MSEPVLDPTSEFDPTDTADAENTLEDDSLDERRRLAALDYARSVQHNGIDDYLKAASAVNNFLKSGQLPDTEETPI